MRAAIENFAHYKSDHKLVLLGDMFELGEYSREEHQKLLDLLKNSKFEQVMLVGNEFFSLHDNMFKTFKTTEECKDYLRRNNVSGSTILIKGSRGMKMEVLQEVL
jgi:UDP-N-acetylmuramoyl-tripeptide--D-alanyl-D-alanine ligase